MINVRLNQTRARSIVLIVLVLILLAGLPLAVWLDLQNLTDAALRRQASDLNSVITSVRSFYASNVVGRVLSAPPGTITQVTHNYQAIPGAIPIPATLSLELGRADHHEGNQRRCDPLRSRGHARCIRRQGADLQ
jgi:adenylate cyclase